MLYERAYVSVTGDSFLHYYLGLRLGLEGDGGSGWPFPFNKIWNAGWYAAHVAWYGAPWSALLAGGVVMWGAWRKADLDTRGWLRFTLLASLAVIGGPRVLHCGRRRHRARRGMVASLHAMDRGARSHLALGPGGPLAGSVLDEAAVVDVAGSRRWPN